MKNLLLMQAFFSLGNAVSGIFFAFLLMEKFSLSFAEILGVLGLIHGCVSLISYHSHSISFFSIQQKLSIGIFFLIASLVLLSLAPASPIYLFLILLSNTFYITFLYPSLHWINIELIDESTRGQFLGNMQAISMGALVLGPLISGILIDINLSNIVLLSAIFFHSIALYFAFTTPISKTKSPQLSNFSKTYTFFKTQILQKSFFQMSIIEGIQTASLALIYPIVLKISLQKYSLIGGAFFLMASIEIISSKVVGYMTDKYSSKKIMQWGALARALDIAPRGLLVFFPSTLLASILAISAGLLGPLFGVSFYSQLYKRAENSSHSYSFLITREWILGTTRFIFFTTTAIAFHFIGIYALAVALFTAGFLSFFLKKM